MWRRLVSPLYEFGPAAGILYLAGQALARLSPRLSLQAYELMAQPVPAEPLLPPRRRGTLTIRELRDGDPELARMPVRDGVIPFRFAQHATCLGAFDASGTMIGYLWFCREHYAEDEARCAYVLDASAPSAFDFDFYLFPEQRMGMAFVALWDAAFDTMRRLGIRWTFSRMTRFNTASRRAHRRMGAQVIGRALFFNAGRLQLMLGTIAPFFHISLGQATAGSLERPDSRNNRVVFRLREPNGAGAAAATKTDDAAPPAATTKAAPSLRTAAPGAPATTRIE